MKKLVLTFIAIAILGGLSAVNATTFFVKNHADGGIGSGSLRDAIIQANSDNSATPASPHIILDTVTTSNTIILNFQLPAIVEDVIINGGVNSGGLLSVVKAFNNALPFSVLSIGAISGLPMLQYVELNNIKVRDGFTIVLGGGINVQNCTLTMNNCEVFNNTCNNGLGGGIYAADVILNINNSTIANNTIFNNSGGGLYFGGSLGSCTITNSTISGNTAVLGAGGGFDFNSFSPVSIVNSTIANNSANQGAGIYINVNEIFLENSIVVNNVASLGNNDIWTNIGTSVNSINGHNLIGDLIGFAFNGSANTTGNVNPAIDAEVVASALANNGGRTQTLALTPCSEAIDAGISIFPPTTDFDQRAVPSVQQKDIGAYEYPALQVNDQSACGPTSFNLTVSGGTPTTIPFYNWFNTPTGSGIVASGPSFTTPLLLQTDTFYVAEVASCTNPKRYMVIATINPIPTKPTITAAGYPANTTSLQLCNNGPTVTLISSPIASDNYSWMPVASNNDSLITAVGGEYKVTITDANGCSNTSDSLVIISIAPPATPTITSSLGNSGLAICATDTANLTVQTTTLPITHYEWLLNGNIANDTTTTISAIAEGDYQIFVSSGPNCSSFSAPFTVNHNPLPAKPSITVVGNTTFCIGDSVSLTNSDAVNNTVWSVTGETTQTIFADTTGNYFATVTDANGCKNYSDTIAVVTNIPIIPVVTITDNHATTFCDGDSITLTSSVSFSYAWSNGATTQSITVHVSTANLAVTTTSVNSCSATSDSLQIIVIPITTPQITASGPLTFCEGGSVTLTSDQPNNTWFPNGETTTSIVITSTDTVYTIIPGCSDTSAVIIVTVNPNPATPTINNATPLIFCDGGNVVLVSSALAGNTWSDNSTNDSLTVTASGTFSVTVTNAFNCTAVSAPKTVTVLPLPIAPIISFSTPTTFCQGDTIILTSNNNSGNLWSTGETTSSIIVTTSGNYSVRVGDANNCLSLNSDTVTIIVNVPITPIITADDVTTFCAGDSVHLTSSVTSNIVWSNGATTASITVLVTDTFTVSAIDPNNSCIGTSLPTIVTVNQTTPPIISAASSTTFCAGGSVILSSSAPTGNSWFVGGVATGQTTQSITVSNSGTYTVSIPGCAAVSTPITVTKNNLPAAPIILHATPTTFCAGDNVILVSSYNGAGNLWSNGATINTITVNSTGNFSVTFTDANGCSSTSAITPVVVNANPNPPTITTNTGLTDFCTGSTLTLSSNYTFGNEWSTNATTNSIVINAGGNYTVTHTNINGCTASSSIVINEVAPFTPTITIIGNDTICQGGSVTLVSSATVGNVWNTGETTQSITITTVGTFFVNLESCGLSSTDITIVVNALPTAPVISATSTTICNGDTAILVSDVDNVSWAGSAVVNDTLLAQAAGNYFASITDANGCSNISNTLSINVINQPFINLGTPNAQCGGLVNLDAGNPGSTYLWSDGTTNQTNLVSTGSFSVIVSNSCGIDTSNTVNVVINPVPIVALGADIAQCGGTVSLDAQNAGADFNWNNVQFNTQVITAATTGTYNVTVTNAFGCSASDTINVNVDGQAPVVALGNDVNQCEGTVTLNAGNVGSTYTWVLEGTSTILSTQQTFTATTSGSYVASVTNGCGTVSDTITININANPIVTLSAPSSVCNANVTLDALNAGSTYLWNDNSTNQTLVATVTGTYSVTVTNAAGCSASASVNVVINVAAPVLELGPTQNVCGGPVTLDALNAGSTYNWILPNATFQNTQTISVSTSGNYKVIVNNGCGNVIDSVLVNIFAIPTVNLGGPFAVCDNTVTLQVPNNANFAYTWTQIGSNTIIDNDNSFTATTTGDYKLVVVSDNNCTNSDTAEVSINTAPITVNLGTPAAQCEGSVTLNAGNAGSTFNWSTGETTQQISVATIGVTPVSVTVTNACGTSTGATIVTINAIPTVNLGGPYSQCQGTVTLNAGNQGATYLWSNNSTANTLQVSTSGIYSVVVTAHNCSASASATVNIDSPIAPINLGTPPATCGTNVILDAGNITNATYAWFEGTTNLATSTQTFSATTSGAYTVQATNTCGTVTSSIANVVINTVPTVNLGGPYTQCTPVTLTAGTQDVGSTYVWSLGGTPITPAATNNSLTASTSGLYSVVVTSPEGCSATGSTSVTIQTSLTALPIVTPVSGCGSVSLDAGNYPLGTTYQWFDANNVSLGFTTQVISLTSSGIYTVTATNTCGSVTSNAVAVTVNTAPTVNLGSPITQCGGTVVLTAGTQVTNTTYVWSINNSPIVPAETNNSYTASATGTYSVLVTTPAGCTATSSVSITIQTTLTTLPIVAPASNCGSFIANAGSYPTGTTFEWFNAANVSQGVTTQTFTITQSGTYYVAITNTCGTVQSNSVTITIETLPVVNLGGPYTQCGGTVALSAGTQLAGSTFAWSLNTILLPAETSNTLMATTGTYSVLVTTLAGCTATSSATVNIQSGLTALALVTPLTSCGSLTINAGTYPAGTTFEWFDGNNASLNITTQSITVTTSGTYFVKMTNTCGTVQSAPVTITIEAVPTVNLGGPFTQCGGSVALNAGTQLSGSTYSWSFNNAVISPAQTNNTLTASATGIYSVLVTTSVGCSATSSASVTIDTLLSAQAISAPPASCNTATLSAGTYPSGTTYEWFTATNVTTNITTETLTVTQSGSFYVKATNNCGTVQSNTVSVTIEATPTVNIGGPYNQCNGVVLNAGTQFAGTTFFWTNSAGTIVSTSNTFNATTSSTYAVVVTTPAGCSATSSASVTIDAVLAAQTIVAPPASCNTATLDAGTYPTGTTYEWFTASNITTNITTQTLTVTQSGSFYVKATNNCGTVQSNTVSVTIEATPIVNIGGPYNQCNGVVLNAGTQIAGTTFSWTYSAGTIVSTSNTYNATTSSTYTVVVTTPAGCSATSSASVNTAVNAPIVSLAPVITNCGSVTLDAQNAGTSSTYLWSPNGETTQTIVVASSGSYSVTVTNACGTTTSNVSVVTINQAISTPTVTASGATTFCVGNSVVLTANTAPTNGSYLWLPGGATTQSITVTTTGGYTVSIINSAGCSSASALTQVNVGQAIAAPVITASGPTSFCPGGSVTLTSSYATGNFWTPLNSATQSLTVTTSNTYTVTVTDAFGCTNSASTTVTVLTPPLALITSNQPSLVCAGETIKLWADASLTSSNVWNLSGAGATTDSITFTALTGTVSYSVTATSTNGCTATSPVYTFTYVPSVNKPIITATASGKNCDGSVILSSSEANGNIWFNGATTQTITITETVRAYVRVENAAGCSKTSDTTWFAATAGVPIVLKDSVSHYNPGDFNVSSFGAKDGAIFLTTTGGVQPLTYTWKDSTNTYASSTEDINGLGAGTYYITVNDNFGCKVSDTIRLKEPREFKLPTGFSPNGDGKNDFYIVGAIEKYPNNKIEIYNRWGSIVYSKVGYNNEWNGKNDGGEDLTEGTYYVILTFPNSSIEALRSYVDLKR